MRPKIDGPCLLLAVFNYKEVSKNIYVVHSSYSR